MKLKLILGKKSCVMMDGTRANPTQRGKKENVVSAIISGGTLPLDDVSSGFEHFDVQVCKPFQVLKNHIDIRFYCNRTLKRTIYY